MAPHETWRLTIQPWMVSDLTRFDITRITYNKHARQVFTPVLGYDVRHPAFEQGLDHATDELYRMWDNWLAKLELERRGELD